MSETVWGKADLHVHSRYSDGAHTVRQILEYTARKTDLSVIAITDHDCLRGALEAQRLAPRYDLDVVVGEEITTDRGHLLALFIHEPIPSRLSLAETVARVHAQGGLAVLAHPYDGLTNMVKRSVRPPTPAECLTFGLDGMEVINGCQLDPGASGRARQVGTALSLALTGGSDGHHKGVVGVAHTLFRGTTAADLRRALEQRTSIPGGRRWNAREYAGWLIQSFFPRRVLQQRPLPLPRLAPESGGYAPVFELAPAYVPEPVLNTD